MFIRIGSFIFPTTCAGVGNLIDLGDGGAHSPVLARSEPEYVNDSIIKKSQLLDNAAVASKDPFDMREYQLQLLISSRVSTIMAACSGGIGVRFPAITCKFVTVIYTVHILRSRYTSPVKGGVTVSQFYLQSLVPLSAAGLGRLLLGVPHRATSVALLKVVDNWPSKQ